MVSGLGFRVLGLGQKTHNQYLDINYACALSPHVYILCGWLSNYGPFLGTLNIRCRTIIGIQKGTIILTTAHVYMYFNCRECCLTGCCLESGLPGCHFKPYIGLS